MGERLSGEQQDKLLRRARMAMAAICQPEMPTPSVSPVEPKEEDAYPSEWQKDFDLWRTVRCTQREGREDWSSVSALWIDFSEWVVGRASVPCSRATFEVLLARNGLAILNGMADMVLTEDLLAVLSWAKTSAILEREKEN
jgi:hypothetical protein